MSWEETHVATVVLIFVVAPGLVYWWAAATINKRGA